MPELYRKLSGDVNRCNKRQRKSMLGQKNLSHRLKDDEAEAHLVPFKTSRTMKR
jgi:hypothetical protein